MSNMFSIFVQIICLICFLCLCICPVCLLVLQDHQLHLDVDELTAVRTNLQKRGCSVDAEYVSNVIIIIIIIIIAFKGAAEDF